MKEPFSYAVLRDRRSKPHKFVVYFLGTHDNNMMAWRGNNYCYAKDPEGRVFTDPWEAQKYAIEKLRGFPADATLEGNLHQGSKSIVLRMALDGCHHTPKLIDPEEDYWYRRSHGLLKEGEY